MISTKHWVDSLRRQYTLASESDDGLELLLTVRQFVAFLNDHPHAQRYLRELDYRWEEAQTGRHSDFCEMREALSELEQEIREKCGQIRSHVAALDQLPDRTQRFVHILNKIDEADWYQSWVDAKDDLDLNMLHIERPPQTKTGYMISHAFGITQTLAKLAGTLGMAQEATTELRKQAENLLRQYRSARQKLKYDWMSSGKHALVELHIAVSIIDQGFFIDPPGYHASASLDPWTPLMVMCAPPGRRDEFQWRLNQAARDHPEYSDFKTLYSRIRLYLRQVFNKLQSLADSRLAHQHLVERYKVRCESYDWKDIARLIEDHAEEVSQRAEETGKQATLQVEDLLTLHFARYLYDNGYPVHYRPRFGRQEPDLLGESLEPIVVEAKVVTEKHRPNAGRDWIHKGLRALLEYLRLLQGNYGVTDGYLVVFRIGDEKRPPMYVFEPDEWTIGPFTIVPVIINVGKVPKDVDPVRITQGDFLKTQEQPEPEKGLQIE